MALVGCCKPSAHVSLTWLLLSAGFSRVLENLRPQMCAFPVRVFAHAQKSSCFAPDRVGPRGTVLAALRTKADALIASKADRHAKSEFDIVVRITGGEEGGCHV